MRVPGIPYIQGRNYATNPAGRHYGIAVHCTASTATARQEADYATRRTDGIGSHFYVDGVEAIQSVDTIYKVNHAGSANGNNNAICLEQTGRTDWTREHWLSAINWGQMSYALAAVIKAELGGFQVRRASIAEMKANPRVAAFYSHDDMRLAWGGTTHTDPGPNYPWDKLFDSVNQALGGSSGGGTMTREEEIALIYRTYGMYSDVPVAPAGTMPDDQRPNLLHERLVALQVSLDRVEEKIDALIELGGGGPGGVAPHGHSGSATTTVSVGDVITP